MDKAALSGDNVALITIPLIMTMRLLSVQNGAGRDATRSVRSRGELQRTSDNAKVTRDIAPFTDNTRPPRIRLFD